MKIKSSVSHWFLFTLLLFCCSSLPMPGNPSLIIPVYKSMNGFSRVRTRIAILLQSFDLPFFHQPVCWIEGPLAEVSNAWWELAPRLSASPFPRKDGFVQKAFIWLLRENVFLFSSFHAGIVVAISGSAPLSGLHIWTRSFTSFKGSSKSFGVGTKPSKLANLCGPRGRRLWPSQLFYKQSSFHGSPWMSPS